jgi:ABC-type polysaccharide/polyol phosphate transport system ATPase subunit
MRRDIEPVVEIRDVTREFRADRDRRSLFRVLSESMSGRGRESQRRRALRGVSLTVCRGEKIAVIGNNAAGKSTLLKIVAGLLRPTTGTARVRGEMVLLTSLGVGMIDEVSVLDNTLMYGALYGVEPAHMRAVIREVLEWAGIPGYEDAKLKTLSTGMRARLAFSVVRYIATDIFLIDEALSAGDVRFRVKSRAFFDEPRNETRTFLVATHDMSFAESFCTRALWLNEGQVMAVGDSGPVVAEYIAAQR